MSFERALLVEFTCHYEVSISCGLKVMAKVKVDNRQTDRTKYLNFTEAKNSISFTTTSTGAKGDSCDFVFEILFCGQKLSFVLQIKMSSNRQHL